MKDQWEVKEIFDRTTGKVDRIYTFKRKPCKRVVLESRLAQQLAGYTLIEKDLRSVAAWLEEIKDRHVVEPKRKGHRFGHSDDRTTYTLIKGLFVAALTFYGKCFAQCEGRRVKLERSQLEERFRESHDEAMKFRHNFAAHSGAAKLEDATIALVFQKKLKSGEVPRIYHELWQPDLFWSDESSHEASFIALTEHVHSIVKRKMRDLTDKIMQEEVLPKGADFWSRK